MNVVSLSDGNEKGVPGHSSVVAEREAGLGCVFCSECCTVLCVTGSIGCAYNDRMYGSG